ncbi:MAG: transporter substrate-binding domain-containing protein, partial [Clostridia bacterium]|nr:transporter substrate-binding domain-containing protein [Clostridia bacterium]
MKKRIQIQKGLGCGAIALLLLFVCMLSGCGNKTGEEIRSLEDLSRKGLKIGVEFDLPEHEQLKRDYPDAAVVAYTDYHLGYEDVSNGRLDAYVYSRIEMEFAIENGVRGVRILDDSYCVHEIAVGLSPASRIPDLQVKINSFLSDISEDGTLDDMYSRWVVRREETMPEIPKAESPSGTLRVGTTGILVPFTYYVGDRLNGYDIELAYRFAAWLNMDVEFRVYDFSGIVSAATSGDIDCIMSNLFKTEEIAETIPFSETLFTDDITAMVRDTGEKTIQSLADLKQGRVAILTGSNFAEHVLRALPDAELLYFNTLADEVNAVKNGKADAVAIDEPSARYIMAQDDEVTYLQDMLEPLNYGFIFPKDSGESLRDQFNEFLAEAREDGLLKELEEKWFDASDLSKIELADYRDLPAVNGVLDLATMQNPPFSFARNNLTGGYDIELFYLFCRKYGYALDVTDMPLDAVLSSVQSGKFNAACCGISITEERKESMLFSDPDYSGGTVLLVSRGGAGGSGEGFFQSIGSSFYKTFIREDRWIMFLEGIGTTLLITVLSVLAGTLLGFFVFM